MQFIGRLIFLTGFCVFATSGNAEKVTLEKPVPVTQKKTDKSKIVGKIVAYDENGFDVAPLKLPKGQDVAVTENVGWDELDARTAYAVRKTLIDPKDPVAHVELGRAMLGVEGGKEWSEKAFAIALRFDPTLKKTVDEIKKDAAETPAPPKTKKNDDDDDKEGSKPPGGKGPEEVMARAGPETIGGVEDKFWGALSDDEQQAAVDELKEFAEQTRQKMKKSNLALSETKYFLFYSDLPAQEAKNWSGLLDRMYAKLAQMFAIDKGVNIWRGKALVFVFSSASDYRRFQTLMHDTDSGSSDGMCHTFGDGMVHIAFYRQPKELDFAHVLVHESVHGFIHRYKTPARVPSWANEGLAEWIATQLLIDKRPNRPKEVRYNAQQWLREMGGVGAFFETQHIEGWQYPVAEMLTTFMIEQSKKGYVDFINGIKDGQEWDEALRSRFKAPRERLVPAFGQYLNIKNLN
jgi:hypothetical protein